MQLNKGVGNSEAITGFQSHLKLGSWHFTPRYWSIIACVTQEKGMTLGNEKRADSWCLSVGSTSKSWANKPFSPDWRQIGTASPSTYCNSLQQAWPLGSSSKASPTTLPFFISSGHIRFPLVPETHQPQGLCTSCSLCFECSFPTWPCGSQAQMSLLKEGTWPSA